MKYIVINMDHFSMSLCLLGNNWYLPAAFLQIFFCIFFFFFFEDVHVSKSFVKASDAISCPHLGPWCLVVSDKAIKWQDLVLHCITGNLWCHSVATAWISLHFFLVLNVLKRIICKFYCCFNYSYVCMTCLLFCNSYQGKTKGASQWTLELNNLDILTDGYLQSLYPTYMVHNPPVAMVTVPSLSLELNDSLKMHPGGSIDVR